MLIRGGATTWLFGALAALALMAAPAAGDTRLGSALEGAQEGTYIGPGVTAFQEAAPTETVAAPGPGTITSWDVRSADENAQYELRVLRPAGGQFTAIATSEAQMVEDTEDKTRGPFGVNIPVRGGDVIALYVLKGPGAPVHLDVAGDGLNYIADPFPDGATGTPFLPVGVIGKQELLLQASFKAGPPASVSLPTIPAEARVGIPLTAERGTWEGATLFAYQWERCEGASCAPIPGATGQSYTPTEGDLGLQLRVAVAAKGAGGESTARSALSNGVKPGAPQPPENRAPPSISGEARAKETLTGAIGNWSGTPTSYQEQWLRCATPAGGECVAIAGASGLSYQLTAADVGSTIRLRVTAANEAGPTAAESAPTGIVQRELIVARMTISPNPSCTGIPTTFYGGGSTTPNGPIVKYRFTYREFPASVFFEAIFGGFDLVEAIERSYPLKVLAEGSSSAVTTTFTWTGLNLAGTAYVRAFLLATLTVTDRAGDTASTTQLFPFAQYLSTESRAKCPKPISTKFSYLIGSVTKVLVSGGSVGASVPCAAAIACAVRMRAVAGRIAAKSAKRKRKPTLLADSGIVDIPAHKKRTVKAKLTRAAKRRLARGPVHAKLLFTSVDPLGHAITRSRRVTLRRRR